MTKQVIMRAVLITIVVVSLASVAITAQASTDDHSLAPNQTNVEQRFAESVPAHPGENSTEQVLPGHTNISHAMTTHSSGVKAGFGIGLMAIGGVALLTVLSRALVEVRKPFW